jgi:hypothetical protein
VSQAALLLLTAMSLAGIYPEGHWNHATELTVENFEETVKTNVDSGKTFFVRWIASQG